MAASLLSGSTANLSLLVMLAKATVILLAALGITLTMQRASAGARHLVWLVALAALLLVPVLTAWAPLPLRVLPDAEPTSWAIVTPTQAADASVARAPKSRDLNAPLAASSASSAPTQSRASTTVTGLHGLKLVAAIWLVVALAIVASLGWAGLAVRRIVRQARPLDSHDWLAPLWEVADRLGLAEAPRLLRSEEAKMPFACGLLRPTIVLPAECDRWTTERRQAVLLHELAHVRRHDLLGHTLARLVCAAYWFHPLAWTAAKQLRSESERACDDMALSCGTRATDYAEHLLEIVTSVRGDATPSVALAMARRKEFEGRMLAILDPELPHSSPSRRQSAALIGSLALIAMTVGAATPVSRSAMQAERRVARDTGVDQDSRLNGPERKETRFDTRYDKRMETRLERTTRTAELSSAEESAIDRRADSAATAAVDAVPSRGTVSVRTTADARAISSAAATAAIAALQSLPGGRASARTSDDRPVLLARILRTDTSFTIRRTAAWGLREYADNPVAVDALTNALGHDAEISVREMAAWALAESEGRGGAVAALSAALRSDGSVVVRRTAAWALGEIGDNAAAPALTAALSDDSPDVRQRAAWALGSVEPKQAPEPLVALLRDKSPHLRTLAAWALFRIEDPATAPALETALHSETDKEAQMGELRALAAMGEKSVDAIRGLVESPDPRVRTMAVRALAGGHAAGPWPWPWPEPRPFP